MQYSSFIFLNNKYRVLAARGLKPVTWFAIYRNTTGVQACHIESIGIKYGYSTLSSLLLGNKISVREPLVYQDVLSQTKYASV